MKKNALFVLICVFLNSIHSFALDYTISFTTKSENTAIEKVIVQNLSQGTTLTLSPSSNLILSTVTDIQQLISVDESTITIYSNSINGKTFFSFNSKYGGNTCINILDLNGRTYIRLKENLHIGINTFELALPQGVFILQIIEKGISHNSKVISSSNNKAEIKLIGTEKSNRNIYFRVKESDVQMNYKIGDIILFKAFSSGNTSTIIEKISESKTLTFSFTRYKGTVTSQKRYLTCGFDDFRPSDISWVAPLFHKYGFKANFNKINFGTPTPTEIDNLLKLYLNGNDIGDHTILHEMFIYYSPLFNGQNPLFIEGSQEEFPTNNDFRLDRGDGKNVFGRNVDEIVSLGYLEPIFQPTTPKWSELTDEQCQIIREHYSIMKNKYVLSYLDNLSNEFLGTIGSSLGSWNGTIYTNGIYTGCKTSQNHEIWERIAQIQKMWFGKYFGLNQEVTEWSLPGSKNAYLYFEKNGWFYYDREHTQLANDFGQMKSSLYSDVNGNPITRSWVDILRFYGYKNFHDCMFPGRSDGLYSAEIKYPLIINSSVSKNDAFPYCTPRTIIWGNNKFEESYFVGTTDSIKKMYDDLSMSEFRASLEQLRNSTAQGIIAGSVWDSQDTFSEKVFWEMLLKFCSMAGIEVVTKSEAYDIAFNHTITTGNLLYNPNFENMIKNVIPTAVNMPSQPDGWSGNCKVIKNTSISDSSINILQVNSGSVFTKHYGVPIGKLRFSFYAKGNGNIKLSYIRNSQPIGDEPYTKDEIQSITINNNDFEQNYIDFTIKNEPLISSDLPFEGLDNKICGIYIKLNGVNLQLMRPNLKIIETMN